MMHFISYRLVIKITKNHILELLFKILYCIFNQGSYNTVQHYCGSKWIWQVATDCQVVS